MNFIINPYTKQKVSMFSQTGKRLLKRYVNYIQSGGANEIQLGFTDPITIEVMTDPVTVDCGNGHVFERASINAWLADHNNTCPKCRQVVHNVESNNELRQEIEAWTAAGKPRGGEAGQPVSPATMEAVAAIDAAHESDGGISLEDDMSSLEDDM